MISESEAKIFLGHLTGTSHVTKKKRFFDSNNIVTYRSLFPYPKSMTDSKEAVKIESK